MSKNLSSIVKAVKDGFASQKTKSYEWRIKQLKQLRCMIANEEARWRDAESKDLKANEFFKIIEINSCLADIDNAISNLHSWMQPEYKSNSTIATFPGTCSLHKEPYGVVLIISPWNYPVQLLVRPLVGAIAAGNAAVIKPSEVSANVSKLFVELTPKYLDTECIVCIEGGVEETTALLKERWDYIFYTGSTGVGKIIMKAAAENLTPVTLELGGKSPTIVDKNVDLNVAVARIVWGKLLNSGQSCIAPDYIFVHKDIKDKFLAQVKKQCADFHSKGNFQQDAHYSRIINERHTDRIKKLIEASKDCVVYGGNVDVKDRFVEPTLLLNPKEDAPVMTDEIFGPVLPIFEWTSIDTVIQFINKREKPLALYIFSTDKQLQQKIIRETSSGSIGINDTMMQFTIPDLPFGGIGHSGIGSYNGRYSFDTFTHLKSILDRPTFGDLPLRYPPYEGTKVTLLKTLAGKAWPSLGGLTRWAFPVVIALAGALFYYYMRQSKL